MSSQLNILFAGAGEFGVPTFRALLDAGHRIVQVITQPDRPAGRGRKLTPTAIASLAIERGLPLIRTTTINNETLPAADVMVVIAFGQKIGPHVVDHPRLGSVNLHGSRLPRFRGAAPVQAAIVAGDSVTGNSIIRLAPKMDAGAVLAMSEMQIGELETAGELHDRLAADGAPLMLKVLEDLALARAVETVQDESLATIAPKLSRETVRIDWSQTAEQIARKIRGYYPWPACRFRIVRGDTEVSRITLSRARAAARATDHSTPGSISASGTIACGRGAIEVVELQPEAGRPMPLAAYRNGHPWNPGMRLDPI